MNTSPLIPTPVTDKNGKLTTVHKKPQQTQTSAANVPAPQIDQPAQKSFIKFKQREVKSYSADQKINPDAGLVAALGISDAPYLKNASGAGSEKLEFENSHVNAYDVFSVVGIDDGMALMAQNFNDSDSVLEFLHDNGLERLVVDRRDMMDDALRLKIDPVVLMREHSRHPIEGYDPEVYLAATKMAQNISFPKYTDSHGVERTFHDSVLRDEVSLDDVRALGTQYILDQREYVQPIHFALNRIRTSGADYGVDTIKRVVELSDSPETARDVFQRMIPEYGADFVSHLNNFGAAANLEKVLGKEHTKDDLRSLITYQQASGSVIRAEYVKPLHDAGVPPQEAQALLASGLTDAESVIDAYNSSVPAGR